MSLKPHPVLLALTTSPYTDVSLCLSSASVCVLWYKVWKASMWFLGHSSWRTLLLDKYLAWSHIFTAETRKESSLKIKDRKNKKKGEEGYFFLTCLVRNRSLKNSIGIFFPQERPLKKKLWYKVDKIEGLTWFKIMSMFCKASYITTGVVGIIKHTCFTVWCSYQITFRSKFA